ncbi:hypothetical protein [Mycoplasmopsis felis]|uniref:hypothetical protein n=1 Tax=Mycoplasmopsis felis TaxID=33923 RepID=UPI003A5C78F4
MFKDIKSQVSVVHQNNKTKIKRVILSIHHSKRLNFEEFKNEVKRELDNYLLTNFKDYYNKDIKYDINSGENELMEGLSQIQVWPDVK